MHAIRINVLLCFAVVMFVAKPFIGFSRFHLAPEDTETSILVKSFTKRKQEFVENSDFDMIAVQKRLVDPILFTCRSLFFFLSKFFKLLLSQGITITGKVLSDLHFKLYPPEHLYLRAGKLSI